MVNTIDNGDSVTVVLFYDKAIEVMREIMFYPDIELISCEIGDPTIIEYEKEYLIEINDDFSVYIGPAWSEIQNEYLHFCADYVFIDGNASSKILKVCDCTKCYEIDWADESFNCNGDCVDCEDAIANDRDELEIEISREKTYEIELPIPKKSLMSFFNIFDYLF